ncbi:MAG: hypothetical protein EON47_11260 [Acetobacteraceae bacterium]|nr:MAG: hypothetical protein EON47_11260 [Acetobacteraceae bacterium]
MAHFKALIGQELKEPVPSFAPNRAGRILAAGIIQYHLNLEQDYFMVQEAERRCQAVALAAKLHTMDHGSGKPDSFETSSIRPNTAAATPSAA